MHLTDSLSNPGTPLLRLVTALDEVGGLENLQVSAVMRDAIMAQTGAADPSTVRLSIKENRKLSPAEVGELVAAYKAGMSQKELARRFDLHEQTVRAHLQRQEVTLRPVRVLTEAQEDEVVQLYAEEMWT
ncbi:MAG: helix-turn-helix domain-containing protein, partial [Acidobacteria bacterium]|nr:helix-turn-helix domain-containing protein [Acidobacteriota bacterium]